MLAAAGIVVTEISTPIRAADLVEVSDSTPTMPAKKATMNEKASGWEMNWVKVFPGEREAVRRAARST